MNGQQRPAGGKAAVEFPIQEINIEAIGAGPGGSNVTFAVVLISPTRFYVDIKVPELLQDRIILSASAAGGAQDRRNSVHNLLERWMRIERRVAGSEPVPEPVPPPAAAVTAPSEQPS